MAKFCGMCGSKLEEATGLCPRCNPKPVIPEMDYFGLGFAEKEKTEGTAIPNKKEKRKPKKTSCGKAGRFLAWVCLWVLIWSLLGGAAVVGLEYFDVVDIPVAEEMIQDVRLMLHRKHKWEEATCRTPRYCSVCGETEGASAGHSWRSATCEDWEVCTVCGETGQGPLGHNWQDATWLEPRHCLACEETEGKPLGYSEDPAACDLPQPTLKIAVVSSTGKLKLSWNKVEGASKYELYRSTDGGETYSLLTTTTGTSITNTSATAGNTYYYMVKAIHSESGASSAFSSAMSGTCGLPQPTLKIAVVSSTGKLKLSWNKVEGASKYELYRSTDGGETYSLLTTTTGTSITNTSAAAGSKYYYKVKAIHSNSSANSAFSSVVSGTCDLARPEVTVKLNSSGKPVVSWEKVSGATKYTIYIYDADGKLVKTVSTTSLNLVHSSAVKGKTYSYRIVAVHSNENANSAKSTAVSIKSK